MTTNIIFTCPACGSHELMSIQQAVHRTPITLMRTAGGEWSGIPSGSIQELHGCTLGYRCASCRYPDVPNHEDADGFYWQTLDAVSAAGVLSKLDDSSALLHGRFTICQPDGTTLRITHAAPHAGALSIAERAAIQKAHDAPAGSVLLSDSEMGLE